MPKSRRRKRAYTPASPPAPPSRPSRLGRVAAPLMVGFFVLGLLWMLGYYIVGESFVLYTALGPWSLVVGIGFLALGFVFATFWS